MYHRYHLVAFMSVLVLVCSALAFAQTQSADRITSPIVAAQRTVTNGVHPLATKQNDVGRVAGTQVFHRMVLLTQRSAAQEADLQQLLQEQQDPSSPQYHQWLTPADFGERFGPSADDMAKITGWLQAQGFTVEKSSNGRQFLLFTGTSAQVESAFQTEMHRYRVNGKTYFANAKPASIPTALAPAVSGVTSLNSFTQSTPEYHLAPNPTTKVCINPYEGSSCTTALTGPADLSAIYDAAPLAKANVLGQGQSIALIEESNINPLDVSDFRTLTGLPAAKLNVIVNGADPGLVYGDETEAIADVEYAGALAPDAALDVIVTGSTEFNQGVDLSTAYAVDNDIAPITSLSYGQCETVANTYSANAVALYKAAYEQGAAEGISHFVAAGDYGGDACEYLGVDTGFGVNAIGDSPWNVSVGGTEFIMPDPNVYFPPPSYTATGYVPESTWNDYENPEDGRPLAGGGGVSINFTKPAWQTGPGVPADGARDVPDVSLVAGDNLSYMVCERDSYGDCAAGYVMGLIGTSLASPSWASIQALINQQNDEVGGAGNPDPNYYRLAAGSNSPFHDITVGDTYVPANCYYGIFCTGGSGMTGYEATPGYDLATGLGSVDVNKLATNWQPLTGSSTASVTLSTGGVTSIMHGDPLTATVTVTGNGATTPTGDVVLMAGSQGVDRITLGATGTATVTFGEASGVELPGGSYNLTAHYAGDANFAAANSSAMALTVSPEPTTTQISSSLTGPIAYGTPFTLMAAAYGSNSGTGYPVPGTYTFTQGATTLGTVTLPATGEGLAFATSGATAILGFGESASASSPGSAPLPAGTYQVVAASPAASASFQASVSAPVTITVNKTQVLVSLSPSFNNVGMNSTVNLQVTVLPLYVANNDLFESGTLVTGNVDFYDTSTNPRTKLGTLALSSNEATLPVTFSTTGIHSIVAQYDGDANDLANVSGAVDITVGTKVPTSITVSSQGWNYASSPITLMATVTGAFSSVAPTGTITFTDNPPSNGTATTIGTAPLGGVSNGEAQATLSTSTLSAAGVHNITASYSGDTNYIGSTSAAAPVDIISMSLSLSQSSAAVTAGQNTSPISISFATNPNSNTYDYQYWWVNLSCAGLPSGATCVFNPSSFDPIPNSSNGDLSGTSTVNIYTNGPTLQKAAIVPSRKPWRGLGSLALAGLLTLGFRRRWRRLFASLAALAMLVFFLGLGGCGGSGGGYNITNPGTAAGTYAVTVTGTMVVGSYGTFTTTSTLNLTVTAAGQ
ncbi:MAG: Ig-like domain repeat protein [Terracidiphilus sp.]